MDKINKLIQEHEAGQRIDNYLFKHLKGVPKSHIYRLLRKGAIRINKKRVKPLYHLQPEDSLTMPTLRLAQRQAIVPDNRAINAFKKAILYQDSDIIIINKPAGMAVHAGSRVNSGVIDLARFIYPEFPGLELVHRLDRATSGCLLLAKNRQALTTLQHDLKTGKICKSYLLLVAGCWHNGSRMIDVVLNGKEALTEFRPQKIYNKISLLEAILHTGRKHQIRMHAALIGHPVIGDRKYGDWKLNREFGSKRLFLHAAKLQLHLPATGQKITIRAELDQELKQFLARLS